MLRWCSSYEFRRGRISDVAAVAASRALLDRAAAAARVPGGSVSGLGPELTNLLNGWLANWLAAADDDCDDCDDDVDDD